MGFLENFFLPPSADHLHLIKFVVLLVYFIHFPFISLLLGGLVFSVGLKILSWVENNPLYERLAEDAARLLIFRKTAGILLGVLPLLVLAFIEGQVFYGANFQIARFLLLSTLLVAVGITGVYFYERMLVWFEENFYLPLLAGLGSLALLTAGYLIFSSTTALILDTGRWALVRSPAHLLFSWNVVARAAHFFAAAMAVSGAALVFFAFNWPETRLEMEEEYASFVKRFGSGVALAFVLLQPILIFWNLLTLPTQAYSTSVFLVTALALLLIMIISLLLYRLLRGEKVIIGKRVIALFVVTFLVMIATDHLARENAIENHTLTLKAAAEEVENALLAEREMERAESIKPDLALGEEVFTNQCTSCHSFDHKVVGPAYNSVLPKYVGNAGELEAFIRNPQKVNAAFPPMPKLGLSEQQIKSVAAYLLKKMKRTNKSQAN